MVCWDVEGHGCLGFHMGGKNISGRIKQSFYPRTRHGELKVISMIYAPPYLMRRRKPKVKSVARTRNVYDDNPGAHKMATLESKQRLHTITTEHHKIKKASHDTATRYGSIVEN